MNFKSEKPLQLMSGNEAFARGAIEARIGFCASYPGTPSTEITTALMRSAEEYGIHVEWSTNEKVALETCAGASWAGIPAICPMKSLGLNVAADFLLNLNLSGTGEGGLLIIVCDDPRGHSSSNEQDSRFYAKAAYLPLLEPTSCQQAKDIIEPALAISKKYEIPVIVRSTTRLSHSRSIVELSEPREGENKAHEIPRDLFNVPNPHLKHRDLLNKLEEVRADFERIGLNRFNPSERGQTLVISSGTTQMYVQEAIEIIGLKNIATLALATTHPLPNGIIAEALNGKKIVVFVEEVDPFVEEQVRVLMSANSIEFHGKLNGVIPAFGEINTDTIITALQEIGLASTDCTDHINERLKKQMSQLIIPRPLTFCAGCSHRNIYWAIRQVRKRLGGRLVVIGDIGCYSLGVFYDHAMNTMQAMGSGIGVASGLGQLAEFGFTDKVIAVAGDSTFFHACIPGLINAKHKNADVTFIIMDNGTTAMTGFQQHPGSRHQTPPAQPISIEKIVAALDPTELISMNSSSISKNIEAIHRAVMQPGLKIIVFHGVCQLETMRSESSREQRRVTIDVSACKGESCKICAGGFACPAIGWDTEQHIPVIIDHLCVRCGACIEICPHNAIIWEESK